MRFACRRLTCAGCIAITADREAEIDDVIAGLVEGRTEGSLQWARDALAIHYDVTFDDPIEAVLAARTLVDALDCTIADVTTQAQLHTVVISADAAALFDDSGPARVAWDWLAHELVVPIARAPEAGIVVVSRARGPAVLPLPRAFLDDTLPAKPGVLVLVHDHLGREPDRVVHAGARLVIGRDPACDLVLPRTAISRKHMAILERDGGWHATDLGAGAGFRIFGQSVASCRLVAAQQLEVLDYTLVALAVREADPALAEQRP